MTRPAYTDGKVSSIQDEILAVSLRVFARDGYRGLTLRAIASEMGWSSAALYRYYASKDALLAALRVHGFNRMEETLRAAREEAREPIEAVHGTMRNYLRFAIQEPGLFRLMYELSQDDASSWPQVRAAREAAFGQARAAAVDAIAADLFQGDPNHAAHLLWAGCHGLAALALADQLDLGCDFEELVEPLLVRLTAPLAEEQQ